MTLREKFLHITSRRQSSILSASLVLAITFSLSAILGFLRSRFLYSRFFSCCVLDLDAYNAAFRLPDLIFKLLVTGALSASFIPVFSSYLHKDEKKAYDIASTIINLLLMVFVVAALIVYVFARPFSNLIAAGFTPDQVDLMVNLTRVLLVAQIFFLLSNFLTGILQVHQIFLIPSLSPIVYNFFIILGIITLTPAFGIYGAAYGAVVGAFFHFAIQIPVLNRIGFRYSPLISPGLSGVKEVIRLMLPRSLALGLGEVENTVTLFFASTLTAGSISILNLALQLMYLPSRIFGTTVGQASLPILSKNVAQKQLDVFRQTVVKTILQSLFIALPITTLILVQRLAIVRIAFGARQFPWAATLLTAKTLAYLTPAIACQAVIQILIRSFYALHNTRTPLNISFFSLLANLGTAFYFVNYTNMGVIGLAISASLGNLVQCFGLLIMFIKKVDGVNWKPVLVQFNKILFSSVASGFSSWAFIKIIDIFVLDTSHTVNVIFLFCASSFTGLVFYLLSSWVLKSQQLLEYGVTFSKISKNIGIFFKNNPALSTDPVKPQL